MTLFQSTRPYGARQWASRECLDRFRFQSTRPYGARHTTLDGFISSSPFQSTRPYGARRPRVGQEKRYLHGFNPRARTGRDSVSQGSPSGLMSFNPRARTGRDV